MTEKESRFKPSSLRIIKSQRTQDTSGLTTDHDADAKASPKSNIYHLSSAKIGGGAPIKKICLNLGRDLIKLATGSGDMMLICGLRGIRRSFLKEYGWLMPRIFFSCDENLPHSRYQIAINGSIVGHGDLMKDKVLALFEADEPPKNLVGIPYTEPAHGIPALWIDHALYDEANHSGCVVVGHGTIIVTHLETVILKRLCGITEATN